VGVRPPPDIVEGAVVTHAEVPGQITRESAANKQRQRNAKDLRLRRLYGISLDDYDNMLDDQGGRCAICLCRPRTRPLAVDHDHVTGRVRGLLCSRCNHGLLHFAQEDVTILRRAIEYLLKHLEGNRDT
jgi:Recombination endonuclease VII